MYLYEYLKRHQNHVDYNKSQEFKTINDDAIKTETLKIVRRFIDDENDSYFIIVSNIIALSIKNKKRIESLVRNLLLNNVSNENITKKIKETAMNESFSFMLSENVEYYVPIFSRTLNNIFALEPYKIGEHPYVEILKEYETAVIDLFEVYNFSLFESSFTRLIKVKKCGNVVAYYHPDFKTLYFVNDQGRLEYELALFDSYLKKQVETHMVERLEKVADAFFNNDKKTMMDELVKQSLISARLINRYQRFKNKI